MTDWGHRELQEDLARTRIAAGEIAAVEVSFGMGRERVDVLSCRPSWSQTGFKVYEVKVSRADYLSDVRAGKFKKYLGIAQQFFFACPRNLIAPDELPDDPGVGLAYRGAKGWYTRRTSFIAGPRDTELALRALLLRIWPSPHEMPHPSRQERIHRLLQGYRTSAELGKKLGEELHEMRDHYGERKAYAAQLDEVRQSIAGLPGFDDRLLYFNVPERVELLAARYRAAIAALEQREDVPRETSDRGDGQ